MVEWLQSKAAADVLAERRRQVEVEGWTPDHDDAHLGGEIARAAGCYALYSIEAPHVGSRPPPWWPWARAWWKPTSKRRMLVKAGALILAEIERLDRRGAAAEQQGPADG